MIHIQITATKSQPHTDLKKKSQLATVYEDHSAVVLQTVYQYQELLCSS